jgi:hypothetical protein
VNEVESVAEVRAAQFSDLKVDICDQLSSGLTSSNFDLDRVHVNGDHSSAWLDKSCEVERNVAAPAADIEDDHASADSGSLEQAQGSRSCDPCKDAQSLSAFDSTADDVARLFCRISHAGRLNLSGLEIHCRFNAVLKPQAIRLRQRVSAECFCAPEATRLKSVY